MDVRAVVFDIGDVLEVVGPPTWVATWSARLGLTEPELEALVAQVDPEDLAVTGRLDEAVLRGRYVSLLGLSPGQADASWADQWDWYCGVLDEELAA